jgi:membrane protein implicated in regulation of membrane protease activity
MGEGTPGILPPAPRAHMASRATPMTSGIWRVVTYTRTYSLLVYTTTVAAGLFLIALAVLGFTTPAPIWIVYPVIASSVVFAVCLGVLAIWTFRRARQVRSIGRSLGGAIGGRRKTAAPLWPRAR